MAYSPYNYVQNASGVWTPVGYAAGNAQVPERLFDNTGAAITALADGAGQNGLAVSSVATNFVASTGNSTTAQLAGGATFTGPAETVFNQQAISLLFIADQLCTVTVRQYIGVSGTGAAATGTGLVNSESFLIQPNAGSSQSIVANGNYVSISVTNNSPTATTTLNLNVAYGTLPPASTRGNLQVSLDEVNNTAIIPDPVGSVPVVEPPTTMFYEDFTTALDPAKWTQVGTAFTVGGGNLTLPTTAVNGYIISVPTFSIQASEYFVPAWNVRLEATAATGTGRFWGLGTAPAAIAVNSLAQEGVGWQIDTTGVIQAVTYTGGVKTVIATLTRPSDNNIHRYGLAFRGALAIWTWDGNEVARVANLNIATQTVSTMVSYFSSAVTGTPQTVIAATGVGDRSRLHTYIADPAFPTRRAQVRALGSLDVNLATSATSSPVVSAALTSTSTIVADVSSAGNATLALIGGAWASFTVAFEASPDNQTTWLPVTATFPNGSYTGTANLGSTPSAARLLNINCQQFTHIRVRAISVAGTFTAPTLRIAPGAFPFNNSVASPIDGQKTSFSATWDNFASTAATDLFVLQVSSNSTKLIRVTRFYIQGVATAAASLRLVISRKTGFAYAGGTSVGAGATTYDQNGPAASAVASAYSVAPTTVPSTSNDLMAVRLNQSVPAGPATPLDLTWGNRPSQALILRGATNLQDAFVVRAPVAPGAGSVFSATIEWTEE